MGIWANRQDPMDLGETKELSRSNKKTFPDGGDKLVFSKFRSTSSFGITGLNIHKTQNAESRAKFSLRGESSAFSIYKRPGWPINHAYGRWLRKPRPSSESGSPSIRNVVRQIHTRSLAQEKHASFKIPAYHSWDLKY